MRICGILLLPGALGLACLACTPLAIDDDDDDSAPPAAPQCVEHCAATADCSADFTCQGSRCVYTGGSTAPRCSDDASCTPIVSGWLELSVCSATQACVYGVCVLVDGQGHCAMPPPCAAPMVEVEWPGLDGAVTACGKPGYRCTSGLCWRPCAGDVDCGGATPVCGADGHCRCQGQSCADSPRGAICLPSGACGCQSGADCPADTTDACFAGVCGCSSAEVCTDPTVHPDTTWVCEVP